VCEWCLHSGKHPDWPEIDVLVKVKPEIEEDSFLQNTWFDPVVADGPKVDGLVLLQFFEVFLGQEFAGCKVPVCSYVKSGPFDIKPEFLSCCLQDGFS